MRKLVIYICIIFLFGSIAKANSDSINTKKKQINALVFVSIGMSLAANSGSFFDKMKSEFGLKETNFETFPNIYAGTKFNFMDLYRLGLSVDFFMTKIFTGYEQEVETNEGTGLRYINQEMEIKTIPIVLSFEYLPYQGQFRTYTGVGFGVNFGKFYWKENLSSNIFADPRKSGTHFDSPYYAPIARIYTGLELGFDKEPTNHFIGSLILEFKYTMLFEGVDTFNRVKKQFPANSHLELDKNYSILSNYFNLNLAVSFNFSNNSGLNQNKFK